MTSFQKPRRLASSNSVVAFALALFLAAGSSFAASLVARIDANYVAAGDSARTDTALKIDSPLPAAARLRVVLQRTIDVPADSKMKPGIEEKVLQDQPVAGGVSVQFDVSAEGMLAGELRLRAELLGSGGVPLAQAWSDTIPVGIRKRVGLDGTWDVSKVEPIDYPSQSRPKEWKVPELKSAMLPGVVVNDEWFRGWVTLDRKVIWKSAGAGLQPRFVRLSQVHDSALVTVDGMRLPETRPVEDMAVLSHWIEFHSQFKGEENAKNRLMFLDLIPQPPMKLTLPRALAADGSADVQIKLRGSSGMFRQKPAYGIAGDLHLEMTPAVYVKYISFDTEKAGDLRRFRFRLVIGNETGKPFNGTLRGLYRRFDGKVAYTGHSPVYAGADQPVALVAGDNTIEVVRDEVPRFDTCRATFLLMGGDGKVIDGDDIDFHTVVFEIRDRRDFYLNNERFIVKGQGSSGDTEHKRWQLRLMGGNAFRGPTDPDQINVYQSEGLLTSCGGALLASVEKCAFYNPADTSNIIKAVKGYTDNLSQCPGIVIWEATNEMHGDPEDARVAIADAFHKLDPYHRPVLATKGSGEWEAEAHNGRVKGVDIVGCQYLLSKEGVDSITAAVTEQPIMSTEVNWNDMAFARDNLWPYWLEKGVAGSLLFDYSGGALDQPVPAIPPPDNDPDWQMIRRGNRALYQDLVASAEKALDGVVHVKVGNQMPYTLYDLDVRVRGSGGFKIPVLAPGAAASFDLPADHAPPVREVAVVRAEYTTHGGLPHVAVLTPTVAAAPQSIGGAK